MGIPADQRKLTYNKFIKRLKDAGVYSKISAAWIVGADQQSFRTNLINSNFTLTKVGGPVFTANDGVTGGDADYWNTHWNASTEGVDINDFHVSCYTNGGAANGSDLGCLSGGNGIVLATNTDSGASVTFRLNGPSVAATMGVDGVGLVIASVSGTTASVYRKGISVYSASYTPVVATDADLHLLRVNNAASSSGRKLCFVSVGRALSAAEALAFDAAVETMLSSIRFGELLINEPGYAPLVVSADLVVYGATMMGCLAAYEAVRQGRTAVIVGGWRERHVGGMASGGLGFTDLTQISSIGGLARYMLTQVNLDYGRASTIKDFEPRVLERQLCALLDDQRTGGVSIPVYWSTGVDAVVKSGTRILSFTTRDGREYFGSEFSDASYEGDLMAESGCSYIVGNEAAGSGFESVNGWRGELTTARSNNNQFALVQETGPFYNVDPYVVAGNPASGLLPGLTADPGLANGAANSFVQAYNFRMILTNNSARRVTISPTPPANFDIATYEPLLRLFQKFADDGKVYGTHWNVDSIWSRVLLTGFANLADFNNKNGMSTDLVGGSHDYPDATYEERETIWQQHVDYLKGFFYVICYGRTNEGETRIPAQLETDAKAWGFDCRHFNDPYPGDSVGWPYQLYVRESRRLVGDYVHNANDMGATDGTTPRSVKTIGVASYTEDSHHMIRMADVSGTPRIWNTGGFQEASSGGANQLAPIPVEAILPKVSEVTNLTVLFCVSATHVAFGGIRMEFCCATLGQAAGMLAALAIENDDQDLQSVDYSVLRSRLLASASLSGETAPVLPQVN